MISRMQLVRLVDHTLLKPEATADDVTRVVQEGLELGVFSVCVSPSMVSVAVRAAGGALPITAVAGFPSGKHLSVIKAYEARCAAGDGAAEVDMVIDVGAAMAGDFDAVRADIEMVRDAVPEAVLKVIVESAALLKMPAGGPAALIAACRAAEAAGADFVKTSTGFHPSGGASSAAVSLMAQAVGARVGVKASGGIRTAADAVAMIDAGATRLGLSGTRAVLDGLD